MEAEVAVVSPSVAVRPASAETKQKPWWDNYSEDDIVAWDGEMVQYKDKSLKMATVDVVGYNLAPIYSTKIYHAAKDVAYNPVVKKLTGFSPSTFDNKNYPSIDVVRDQLKKIFSNKLVITLGGAADFSGIGLEIDEYDVFDLQSHFFVRKYSERGNEIREGHSLRSLTKFFLNKTQDDRHTSKQDAQLTMDLFKQYKIVKMKDDPEQVHKRYNNTIDYNDIPVIPNPMKKKKCNA